MTYGGMTLDELLAPPKVRRVKIIRDTEGNALKTKKSTQDNPKKKRFVMTPQKALVIDYLKTHDRFRYEDLVQETGLSNSYVRAQVRVVVADEAEFGLRIDKAPEPFWYTIEKL